MKVLTNVSDKCLFVDLNHMRDIQLYYIDQNPTSSLDQNGTSINRLLNSTSLV